jgi:hypothetical protein
MTVFRPEQTSAGLARGPNGGKKRMQTRVSESYAEKALSFRVCLMFRGERLRLMSATMNQNTLLFRRMQTAFFAGALFAVASVSSAKTYVIPHMLETSGKITQSYSFDTQVSLACVTPQSMSPTNPVVVDLFLYDNLGAPMTARGSAICNPCQFELNGNNSQLNLTLGDLITEAGGFDSSVKLGYAVITVPDTEADRLMVEGRIVNSLDTSSSLSSFNFRPWEIENTGETKKTFVLPHILEKEGSIANTQFTFDTTVFMTYTPSIPGGTGATASLYLYDEDGSVMESQTGTPVCAPCAVSLGNGSPRKVSLRLDDLITATGGFDNPVKLGFGIIVVGGSDPDGVALQGFVVNAHTSPFDLSVFGFDPQPIAAAARTFVLPHVLETSGLTSTDGNTFDTTIFATYTGGLADIPGPTNATVSLYLYENNGQPMQSTLGTPVCNPCTFDLSATSRKQTIVIDNLITEAGGFNGVKLGFGVIVVGGNDPDGVNLQGFVVNSHSGPFDLSVFGFEPVPLSAAARVGPPPTRKTWVIPHILEKEGSITTPYSFDTTIYMTYVSPPTTPLIGTTFADLYLFDEQGQMLRAAAGPVCAPCSYQFSGPNQKMSVSIESLIQGKGGFDTPVKTGHAIVLVSGSDPDAVSLQGFVVNSHTSAFDLSVFGFQPEEVKAALSVRVPPHPTVDPVPGGLLQLQWSTNSPGYTVESSGTLSTDGWSDSGIPPIVVGRNYQVIAPTTSTNRFFRLVEP